MRTYSNKTLATLVLLIGTGMNLLSRGLSESFAVFLVPLEQAFDTDRAALTGIYAIYMLVYGLAAPVTGYLIDRFGTRVCYLFGLLVLAISFTLAGHATQLWHLYLLIGVLGGIGTAALGMVPASTLASAWFDRRLPTAMSSLYAALGIGVLLFSPLAQWLIEHRGWRDAYGWLALVPMLVLPVMLLLPWRQLQAGSSTIMPQRLARRAKDAKAETRQQELRRALQTSGFWKLAGVMFFTTMSTYTTLIQLVAFLVESGFAPLFAAAIFGLAGLLSTAGMICAGMFAERFGERNVATFAYTCSILGVGCLALLTLTPNGLAGYLLLFLFVTLFGSVSGSRGPLIAVLSSRLFSGPAQATIYGCVLLAMGIGGAIAGWASGALHDLTGGYVAGFGMTAATAFAGMMLFRSIEESAAHAPLSAPQPATDQG